MPTRSAAAAQGAGNVAPKWVSGTTYALDALVWSPASRLTYIRIVAGAGTTDPSADGTNWALFGPTRQRQRVQQVLTITAGQTSGTATIPAVLDTSKVKLTPLGLRSNSAGVQATLVLTNTTTVTAQMAGTLGNDVFLAFELVEEW